MTATASRRCYTIPDLLVALRLTSSSFFELRAAGRLPFLEELKPRIGKHPRYRADLVDQYLRGEWLNRRGAFRVMR